MNANLLFAFLVCVVIAGIVLVIVYDDKEWPKWLLGISGGLTFITVLWCSWLTYSYSDAREQIERSQMDESTKQTLFGEMDESYGNMSIVGWPGIYLQERKV